MSRHKYRCESCGKWVFPDNGPGPWVWTREWDEANRANQLCECDEWRYYA